MKKIICLISYLIVILTLLANVSLAAFADFDDEAARRETEELLKKQENEEKIEKSNNNYLISLSVDNYKLEPEFNKQIQKYKIEDILTTNQIKINTLKEDESSVVSGDGVVTLQNGENIIRIDVQSERGAVRTYFITAIYGKNEESKDINKEENEKNEEIPKLDDTNKNQKDKRKYAYLIIGIISILSIVFFYILKKKI